MWEKCFIFRRWDAWNTSCMVFKSKQSSIFLFCATMGIVRHQLYCLVCSLTPTDVAKFYSRGIENWRSLLILVLLAILRFFVEPYDLSSTFHGYCGSLVAAHYDQDNNPAVILLHMMLSPLEKIWTASEITYSGYQRQNIPNISKAATKLFIFSAFVEALSPKNGLSLL